MMPMIAEQNDDKITMMTRALYSLAQHGQNDLENCVITHNNWVTNGDVDCLRKPPRIESIRV